MRSIDTEGIKKLDHFFLNIIKKGLSAEALKWLEEKVALVKTEEKSIQLNLAFSHLPRFSSKTPLSFDDEEITAIDLILPGFGMKKWTLDLLCRVWLLMQVPATEEETYFKKINGLFTAAEMNEQIALYTAMPIFHYPKLWVSRCEEGIRSNIGTVLEAIMYHNPYPAAYLSEASWNQLVLKAFFTEKNVNLIIGLQDRQQIAC